MILFLKSSTLGVIGVGSPEDGRERGAIGGGPRRRSGPSPHPHSRFRTIGRQRRGGTPEMSGDGQGMVTGSATGGKCRVGELPVPSPSRAPMDERWTSRADRCAKPTRWPGVPHRFPPCRNYFRFCKFTSGFTPTSVRTLFPY